MYRPKEIRCRLHTGGKTVAEIKERYTGQGLTYRGFESLQRAFDLFDGQEINLFKRERGGEIVYHVAVWPKENMKIMDAVYEAEQTHPDRRYTDDKQKFMLDWLQGKYSAGMAFEFPAEDVEELEVIREEINETDAPPAEKATPPRWRQIRDKRRRRRKA
jgi:hypothetical protein